MRLVTDLFQSVNELRPILKDTLNLFDEVQIKAIWSFNIG